MSGGHSCIVVAFMICFVRIEPSVAWSLAADKADSNLRLYLEY